jgi:hypothetical protein
MRSKWVKMGTLGRKHKIREKRDKREKKEEKEPDQIQT